MIMKTLLNYFSYVQTIANLNLNWGPDRPHIRKEGGEEEMNLRYDMACPQQHNIETKRLEKLTKYRQLAFEMRERHLVVPVIIGALGGGRRRMMSDISRIFEKYEVVEKTAAEMQKIVLMNSETTLRKMLSGLIKRDDATNFWKLLIWTYSKVHKWCPLYVCWHL